MSQSAVQDIHLNPEEEDIALTFEKQNRKKKKHTKKTALM